MADLDERSEELSTISAIYPELEVSDTNPYKASLDIPVSPSDLLTVQFSPFSNGPLPALPTPPRSDNSTPDNNDTKTRPAARLDAEDLHALSHLPSLTLTLTLPPSYPAESPPEVSLSADPQWIPQRTLDGLSKDLRQLWEDSGGDQIVYAYIDHLQQAAERAFDLNEGGKMLDIPHEFKIALLDWNIKAERAKFDQETFECGICLDPKKGSKCYRLQACSHVFCVKCLQDFYDSCITEGEVSAVKCLDPSCGKEKKRPPPVTDDEGNDNTPNTAPDLTLQPSELLQIPLSQDLVKRYVELKHRAALSADKTTAYCPRSWCSGAARPPSSPVDRLAVCMACSYAFCRRCSAGWHGELVNCRVRAATELSAEERATEEYLRLHSSPCPTCDAPCQKSSGCNHMICFRCNTHFCYLCSAWLNPENPYQHFNKPHRDCYQRLWELEGGDGADEDGNPLPAHPAELLIPPDPDPVPVIEEFVAPHPIPVPALVVPENLDELFLAPGPHHHGVFVPEAPDPPAAAAPPAAVRNAMARRNAAAARPPAPQPAPVPWQRNARDGMARDRRGGMARRPALFAAPERRGGGGGGRGGGAQDPQLQIAAGQQVRGLRRFLDLVGRDEEDEWDSDELEVDLWGDDDDE